MQIRSLMQVPEGYQRRCRDVEEFHEKEQELVTEWENRRLMDTGNDVNGVSSALAWDDLTGMRLDAGKVKEAWAKEIQYVDQNPT